MTTIDITTRLCEFVTTTSYAEVTERARAMAPRCLLDALGVSLGASGLGEGCDAFVQLVTEQGGAPESTVFGHRQRVPAESAAFANGAMAHALDYEDAHDGVLLHPNAPNVPAALAVAEAQGGISGPDLIVALVIGCEVACRLARAVNVPLIENGWYPPPIFAAFGATATVGRLMRLTAQQMRDAFSLTLCQTSCSGEIIDSPQSLLRAVRDAWAARAAVNSVQLARRGIRGFELPFEGRAGFFALYARGDYTPQAVLTGLGERFEIEDISFKPWPSCRGTHSPIEAALSLRAEHGLRPDQIGRVRVRTSPGNRMLFEPRASKIRPATAIDAKFSIPFTVALALVKGRVQLQDFTAQSFADEQVLDVARKVELVADERHEESAISSSVELSITDGSSRLMRVEHPLGHPARPLSDHALGEKFRDCARHARHSLPDVRIDALLRTILLLDEVADVRHITELLG